MMLAGLFLIGALMACARAIPDNNASPPQAGANEPEATDAAQQGDVAVYPENGLPMEEKVTLKMGFFESGMGREYIDYAMDTFKQKFPNVSFEVTYSPTIKTIIGTKVSANNDEDMFDLFNDRVPTGSMGMAILAENGKLESQEDLWDRALYDGGGQTIKQLLIDGTFNTVERLHGVNYAIPNSGSGTGLFFDKKLFEQHGWNSGPQTWSEFLELLEDIKSEGIIPITYPGVHTYYLDYAFGVWKSFELAELNGNLAEYESNYRNYRLPQYTAPENVERWNRLYEMGQKGYFPDGVSALDHTQSQMQVLQHKAAMVSTASWVENEMKESTPEGFEWGFMVVPMGDDPEDALWSRLSSGNGFYIWKEKPELNKKWAKEFVIWMLNLDIQQIIGEKGGMMPLRKDLIEDSGRADKLQAVIKEVLAFYTNRKVRGETGYRDVTLTDPALAQSQKVINEAVTAITSGKQDPLPILEEAEKLLERAIEAEK